MVTPADLPDERTEPPRADQPEGAASWIDDPWIVVAGLASLGAAAIHFAYSPVHFSEEWTHGLFFAVLGWVQVAWAVALVRRSRDRRVLAAGVIVNAVTVVIWILSRSVGIPAVPLGHQIEPVGYSDVLATGLEV